MCCVERADQKRRSPPTQEPSRSASNRTASRCAARQQQLRFSRPPTPAHGSRAAKVRQRKANLAEMGQDQAEHAGISGSPMKEQPASPDTFERKTDLVCHPRACFIAHTHAATDRPP